MQMDTYIISIFNRIIIKVLVLYKQIQKINSILHLHIFMLSRNKDIEAMAFEELEARYPEELKNLAYGLVLNAIGRYIESNNLRDTDFPRIASSALYVLTLSLAKKGVDDVTMAEEYMLEQLRRIHLKGYNAIEEIFAESMGK